MGLLCSVLVRCSLERGTYSNVIVRRTRSSAASELLNGQVPDEWPDLIQSTFRIAIRDLSILA